MTIAMHPDRLTPEYLQSIQFPAARLGKRGMDETHVLAFCQWVESELTRLLSEKTTLEQEVWRLRERVRETPAEDPGESQNEPLTILLRAKVTADKYVANAQEYSRDVAADARRRRAEIVAEAEARARAILVEARATAHRAAGPATAPVTREPVPAGRRADLETELARLRTFSQECRRQLRAYLESLTRSIDEWEHAE